MSKSSLKPHLSPVSLLLGVLTITFGIAIAFTATPWPDNHDGVNFLLGVDRYSISEHRPHFPGYPLYIALGKFFSLFASSTEWGLLLLSGVASIVTLVAIFIIAYDDNDKSLSSVASLLLLANPLFFSLAHKIFSEMTALAILLTAFAFIPTKKNRSLTWFVTGALAGLLLGARLSWWPYALVILAYSLFNKNKLLSAAGLSFGVAIWLIPLLMTEGLQPLIENGASFTEGHFTVWGSTLTSGNGDSSSIFIFIKNLFTAAGFLNASFSLLKIPWILIASFSLYIAIRNYSNFSKPIRLYLIATAVYLAWVFLGQNVSNIRHFLPIAPAIALLAAPLLSKHFIITVVAIFSISSATMIGVLNRSHDKPPVARLAEWLEGNGNVNTILYCGDSERFFDRYYAKSTVRSVTDINDLSEKLNGEWADYDTRLICDDIPNFAAPALKPLVTFPARSGDLIDRPLSIYSSSRP